MLKKNFQRRKNLGSQRGFTLVEAMVAIAILVGAISAAMAVAQGSLQSTFFARDRVTAFWLAQEAIEVIKNRRDDNAIANFLNPNSGVDWLEGIAASESDPCYSGDCGVDSYNNQIGSCGLLNNCVLKLNGDGIFNHQAGDDTKFTRKINMTQLSTNAPEVRVTVTVSWPRGGLGGQGEVKVVEWIHDWHPLSGV